MKLQIETSSHCEEPEVKITCALIDARLQKLIDFIKQFSFTIPVTKEGQELSIPLEEVFYFDSVDNQTFLYQESEVFRCRKKLYELEALLTNTPFVRISKNCILNTSVVLSVKAHLGGRMEATLKNGEKLMVSKHYLKDFKNKFVD